MNKNYFYLFAILSFFNSYSQEIIHFTDQNLKQALINPVNNSVLDQTGNDVLVDANNDGEIDTVEALTVYEIHMSLPNVNSLDDIQYFTNLTFLECVEIPVTEINISSLVNLKMLSLVEIPITELDLSANINLQNIMISRCSLTVLNTTTLHSLIDLFLLNNVNLESLNLGELPLFKHFTLGYSNVSEIDFSRYPTLESISIDSNQITTLDLSNNHNLNLVTCQSNPITNLDVSNSPNLEKLLCFANPFLETINIKAGLSNPFELGTYNLPMLRYICADDNYIAQVQRTLTMSGITNCHVNSYCSFIPGGEVYSIEGQSRFNVDATECNPNSSAYPNLKFSITDGTNIGTMFANSSGTYEEVVPEGTHIITPLPENDYFTVFPTTATVTFPAESPFVQDFCLSPNGSHHDLEITLVPVTVARPGFDSDYKINYANKGTTVQSGSVLFEYNDEISDLIATSPTATTSTTNAVSWNFTDLQPFESRFVTIKLNHNSPMESPALNDGDKLQFTATFTNVSIDETPDNNMFQCNQIVVNSHDPNDKTCLEGSVIALDRIGKDVHYMIRFENTGTFAAENIVVKDVIDTDKFDISSLIPIEGSHPFVTKISNSNKVEFILENINLPFADNENDGYIVFKIKTLPNLTSQDTFSNTAEIYFDYNFPIITNTATTAFGVLSAKDFGTANQFVVYPNPVKSIINIHSKQLSKINSLSIYNGIGQVLKVIPNAQHTKTVDVSEFAAGNYFIKIASESETATIKFVKE